MPVTLKDIAKEAGVSMPVVSAVLNKKSKNSRVGEDTRKRIERIADRLNYLPNVTAQNLREKKTNTINVVIPSFRFFEVESNTRAVNSLQQSLHGQGYSLQVTSLDSAFKNQKLIRHIHTDGIILFYWGMRHDLVAELKKLEVPILVVGGKYEGNQASNLYMDHRSGMNDLANKVMEAGHRRIAYINTYPGDINHQEMIAGFKQAATEHPEVSFEEIRLLPDPEIRVGIDQGVHMGRIGLDQALDLDPRPTVVMFNDDPAAMAAVKRAHEKSILIAGDLSITSAVSSRFSQVCEVELASTENNFTELGSVAGEMILERIRSKEDKIEQRGIAVKAIVRESLKEI